MPVNDPYGYIAGATRPSGNYAVSADSSTTRQGTRAEYEKYLSDTARTLELAEAGQDDLWDYVVEPVAFEDFKVTGIAPYEEFSLTEEIGPVLAVISAFVPPLAPFAKAAQFAISASDGDIGLSDVLNIANAVGFNPLAGLDNPLKGFTDGINSALGIDPESAFALTDDVLINLAEGDLKGAALEYANTGMLPDIKGLNLPDIPIELPTGLSDALAVFDDVVIQPVIGAAEPIGDAVGAVGAAVDDLAIQPVVQAGSALNDVAEPLTSLVSDLGDVAQTEILDPLVAFGSDFEDGASDLLTDVAQPIEQAAVAVGDTIADVAEPAIKTVSDALAAAEDAVSEAIPSTSINLPSLDLSMIAQLFDVPAVSFRDDPTRTTQSLFGDLFKFKTEITRV